MSRSSTPTSKRRRRSCRIHFDVFETIAQLRLGRDSVCLYTRLYSGNLLLSSSWILERRQEGKTRSSKLCACSLEPLQIRAHGPQTNDFKFSLARTKELATRLPGGELTLDEQDEIIQMLEAVRDGKK